MKPVIVKTAGAACDVAAGAGERAAALQVTLTVDAGGCPAGESLLTVSVAVFSVLVIVQAAYRRR